MNKAPYSSAGRVTATVMNVKNNKDDEINSRHRTSSAIKAIYLRPHNIVDIKDTNPSHYSMCYGYSIHITKLN